MNFASFWGLIEESKAAGDPEAQAAQLERALSEMPASEVLDFCQFFDQCYAQLHTWPLWDVIYYVQGGCSDDSFDYFKGWVMCQGRESWQLALIDPEELGINLVDRGGDPRNCWCESIIHVGGAAYESVSGRRRDRAPVAHVPEGESVIGDELDESFDGDAALAERFPRLAARLAERGELGDDQGGAEELARLVFEKFPGATKEDVGRMFRAAMSRAPSRWVPPDGAERDKLIESITRFFPDRRRSSGS